MPRKRPGQENWQTTTALIHGRRCLAHCKRELERTPLWMFLRHTLKMRGLEFRLFCPNSRSSESAAAKKLDEIRGSA
jgi:hypothetical protein